MNSIKQFWDKFKTEADIWFFYGFLLTFPFSIRKVIAFFPIRDQFNEYSGIYLYLSDIFLILAFLSWFIILYNKYSILSIYKSTLVNRHKLWTKLYPQFSPRHILAYLSLILVLWSFLSILWSDNQVIALFRSIKLIGFFLLAIYVAFRIVPSQTECSTPAFAKASAGKTASPKNVPRLSVRSLFHVEQTKEDGIFSKDTIKLIIFGGVINSIFAIWQFSLQHSVGLTFLKESLLSLDIAGVAKIVLFGHKLIRAYGFFPHPNILGGFLLFSIVLTIYYRKMFRLPESLRESLRAGACPSEECSTWNIRRRVEHFWAGGTLAFLWSTLLVIQIIALILTFSKSALLGLLITLIYINVPRLSVRRMFHVEHSKEGGTFYGYLGWNIPKILLVTFFALFAIISIFPNPSSIQTQSLEQRETLSIVPRGTIANNPILGIGQGQLIWSMRDNRDLLDWQFQPVHNIFLLIWSELGIVGLILFVWLLWKLFHDCPIECSTPAPSNVPRGTFDLGWSIQPELKTIFQGILLGFIFIMLFDHYPWDIQQGQIILWLVIGFIYGLSLTSRNTSDTISL